MGKMVFLEDVYEHVCVTDEGKRRQKSGRLTFIAD